jgi:tetratricopeptide (TPR) repeat protein/4-amino-4-deoxy-L-arabinose transferase-like glycosyltransferase
MVAEGSEVVGSPHRPVTSGGPGPSGRFDKRDWRIVAVVFLAALVVRGVYLYQAKNSPTFRSPVVDAMTYHVMAEKLAGPRHLMDAGYFWQPFFYPFLLAVIYLFSGTSILTAKVVQIFIGSGTCAMTYALGRKIFGRKVGILAAGMVVFYGPMIFWEADLMGDWLAGFWSLVLLLLFLRARQTQGLWTCFAIGLCGVLGILTRPTILPFFVAACAYLAWTIYRSSDGRRLVVAAVRNGLGGFLAVALPVMGLNCHVTGDIALLPSSGGINLYIGNNPDMCRTLTVRPGYDWEQLCALPEREGIPADKPAEQQAFFYRKVREYAFSQPLSFLADLGAKTQRFFSSRELPRNIDIYMFRQWSPLLAALVWKVGGFGFPFGVLLPLALVGIVLRWRSVPAFLWIFLVLYPAAVIFVFVAGRYRIPVVPAMAVMAAAGVFALVDLVRRRCWLIVGGLAAVLAATVVVAPVPGAFCEEQVNFAAELPYDIGLLWYEYGKSTEDKGYYEKAAAHFQEAIRIRGDYPEAYLTLGNCRALQGRLEDALACYKRVVELNPKLTQALGNIGVLNRKLKRWEEARDALCRALAVDESYGLAHYHLAMVYLVLGQPDQAQEHLVRAAELDPDKTHRLTAQFVLADVQAADGRVTQAVATYQQVLAKAVKASSIVTPRVLKGLAWLLATSPDGSVRNGREAVRLAEVAAKIDGDSPDTQDILAASYAEVGRFPDALAAADRAIAAAQRAGKADMAADILARRQLYQAGQPYRRSGPYPFFPLP